jgi:hypothetical protein
LNRPILNLRPIFSLWPYLWRESIPFVMLAVLSVLPSHSYILNCALGALIMLGSRRSLWRLRFIRQVRRFQTATQGRIVLHYAPELDGQLNMSTLLQRCQEELDYVSDRLAASLRGRLVVYLFATGNDIGKIFGRRFGGAALSAANAIVIPNDCNFQEITRHELIHVFSGRWNAFAPPILSEGLSVWLQETRGGQPIDAAALPLLLGEPDLTLPLLLKPKFFFADQQRHACYILAGSFTGFLLRRHGLKQYRKLFRHCDSARFRPKFEKCFGVTLEVAEQQWRDEIIASEVLTRMIKRIKWR